MRKKFLKVTVAVMLVICTFATIVNALSFTATMTPSSSNVEEATEFTIQVKVSNLDVGPNGINTISGILEYDTNVFETISDSSIEGLNSWSPSYNTDTQKITLTKTTFVKTEELVFQVTFKTKSELEDGTVGQIQFTDIMASNSETDITASDISTSISVGEEPVGNTANTTNENTGNTLIVPNINATVPAVNNTVNNTTNNVVNNTNRIVPGYVNQENSVREDMPHTGVEDTLVYFIGAAIILSIVFYIKFESLK